MPKFTSNLRVDSPAYQSAMLLNKNIPVNKEHMSARFFFIVRIGFIRQVTAIARNVTTAILDYK